MTFEQLQQAVIAFRVMQPTKPLHLHLTSKNAHELELTDEQLLILHDEAIIIHVDDEVPQETAVLAMREMTERKS